MRRVTLIRHAHPDIPLGERWCLGLTDIPLGPVGRMQAALLPYDKELTGRPVFSSYLSRAVQTAQSLCSNPQIIDGLQEQDLGEWDGLPFSEIMVRWPELYAAREKDPDIWPESAETTESVRKRMIDAVLRCLEETDEDPILVSHKSAIASLTGQRPKLNHTTVSTIVWDGKELKPETIGRLPHPKLTEEVCLSLLYAAGTPEPVIAHCRAVARKVIQLLDGLEGSTTGPDLNRELLFSAAMLHDIARTEPDHAAVGAAWIRTLGYSDAAEVIAQHHDFAGPERSEAALLYLADKYIQGETEVSLEERFTASRKRCTTEEALQAHNRRYETALRIEKSLNRS